MEDDSPQIMRSVKLLPPSSSELELEVLLVETVPAHELIRWNGFGQGRKLLLLLQYFVLAMMLLLVYRSVTLGKIRRRVRGTIAF